MMVGLLMQLLWLVVCSIVVIGLVVAMVIELTSWIEERIDERRKRVK